MQAVLDSLCDYRRYCWNQGLELWNTMYEARLIGLPVELRAKIKASLTDKTITFSEEEQALRVRFPSPSHNVVRDGLVAQKANWQFEFSARVLQQAIKDLARAWNLFFKNPKTAGKPGFKSRKKPKQGFKTDRARIIDGRLVLDKPHAYKGEWSGIRFRGAFIPDGKLKFCAVTRTKGKYIATITMDVETVALPKTGKKTAVDANVDHFDTTEGQTSVNPRMLDPLYAKVRTYQRQLARKRKVNKNYRHSKSYQATRAKLQATYERIRNIQNDLLHKFTTVLYCEFDTIVIEDLDVKGMQMKKKAKNLPVLFSVDSANLWNTRLKSSVKCSLLQTVSTHLLNVVPTVDISKPVMRKSLLVETPNMEPNIMNMFVMNAVMRTTATTMQFSTY